jgi:hypothetical protein
MVEASKVFVGTWVDEETRKKFKIKCVELDVNQGDVIDLLMIKWLKQKNTEDE